MAKEEVLLRIAMSMGGLIAEKLVFGPEKITRGAEEDIETATDYATSAIKDYGMGALQANISIADSNAKYTYHDNKGEHNNEVKALLQEGVLLAEKILLSENNLLLQLSDYLSDERIIKKDSIEQMVRNFGSAELKNIVFIEDGNNLYYRSVLKQQIAEKNKEAHVQHSVNEQDIISLNKKM